MTLSRLSDENIQSIVLRSMLHDEIRNYRANDAIRYVTRPDEAIRADLTAYRVYNNVDLMWCCQIVSGYDDLSLTQAVGVELLFPPITWIRDRIRYYESRESL